MALDWKKDLLAGFLVFLLALPLSLGIAMASGFPPIAGLLTAIVGGVVVTWLGSADLTIKGPAAGMIVIVIGAVTELGGDDVVLGYRRALAVGVVAAAVQIVMALLKAGKLGDFFPSNVVHGMLAAIGVIIVSKQVHIALGVMPHSKEPLELLAEIPASVVHANPEIALIGGLALLMLVVVPLLPGRLRRLPAAFLVLGIAIPLAIYFHLSVDHDYDFAGASFHVGPNQLVPLSGSLIDAIVFPDFSVVWTAASLKYVVMYALVGTIESLLSVKAADQLDPDHHESDLNKDLLATGVGNLIVSFIGGLPMISEIVRSSANIKAGATSRRANFFHGVILLFFVAVLPFVLKQIPLAALAAMLVYTGLILASPKEFVHMFRIGPEQLVVFLTTFLVTLATDLLVGVAAGIVVKLLIHLYNGAPLRSLFVANVRVEELEDGTRVLKPQGAALFSNFLGLKKYLESARVEGKDVVLDFSESKLVDHSVMEKLTYLINEGRHIKLYGLDGHVGLSEHKLATRKRLQ
jgi:MFS superfamily sulfate permease-like transporter